MSVNDFRYAHARQTDRIEDRWTRRATALSARRTMASRVIAAVAVLTATVLTSACGAEAYRQTEADATTLTGGDPNEGRQRIRDYGCAACHTVPGVRGAKTEVGPPLAGLAGRMYIAGLLPNTPENLMRWIEDPTAVDLRTAMPDVGVTPSDARDIAAYLYTLK